MLKKLLVIILVHLSICATPDAAKPLSDALELVTSAKPVQEIIAGYYLSDKWQEILQTHEHIDWYWPVLSKESEFSFFQSLLDVITVYKPVQILITQYLGGGLGSSPARLQEDVTWGLSEENKWSPKRLKKEAKFYLTLDPMLQAMNNEHTAEYHDGDATITVHNSNTAQDQLVSVPSDKRLCALNFSPDGRYLVAATHENDIKIWERPNAITKL